MGVWFGTSLPADYGNFEEEYGRASRLVALVDTNFQLVAELTGQDRVRYLNAVTSGNIRDLASGQSAPGLLLNPQGHILAELRTLGLGDRLTFLSHALERDRTLATLDKFIIMDDVTLQDRTDEFSTMALVGPEASAVVRKIAGINLSDLSHGGHAETSLTTPAGATPIACRVLEGTSLGLGGAEFLIDRARTQELWRALVPAAERHGGGVAGYRAIEALRLEAGVPWFGADFDDRMIPHEAGLEQSHISYVKGCYTGQEIVERVRSRGQVNRRRVGLAFSGDSLPPPGAKLKAEGKEAGWVTSAAFSPRASRGIGMGYLRREFIAPGARLDWDLGEAQVIELPLKQSP